MILTLYFFSVLFSVHSVLWFKIRLAWDKRTFLAYIFLYVYSKKKKKRKKNNKQLSYASLICSFSLHHYVRASYFSCLNLFCFSSITLGNSRYRCAHKWGCCRSWRALYFLSDGWVAATDLYLQMYWGWGSNTIRPAHLICEEYP